MTRACWTVLVACSVGWVAAVAHADEIHVIDEQSCETKILPVAEISSETWAEIKYRVRPRGPEQSVPARLVVDIVRTEPAREIRILAGADADLSLGRFREALAAYQSVAGGGLKIDATTGASTFTPFTDADPPGRRTRAPWFSEYAHIGYARALFARAEAENDVKLYEQVLMVLEDRPLPDGADKQKRTTGGFLKRFEGGNSRWYPEAMRMHAHALLRVGDADKARAAFKALEDESQKVPLDPVWTFEGMLGEGLILEAEGKDAETAFDRVANTMVLRLEREKAPCAQRTYGRLYSAARHRVALARLLAAEKSGGSGGAYSALRQYVEQGEPATLIEKFGSKLSEPALQALLAGARAAGVQAVALNGKGLAWLEEKRFEEAVLAFKEVTVKHFADADQTARALYYLARAAEQAAAAADKRNQAAERDRYNAQRDEAVRILKSRYRASPWAQK